MSRPGDPAEARPLDDPTWVRRLVRRLGGDEHAAQDVIQELWVAHLSRRPEPNGNRWAWFRTLARNTFLKHRRGEERRARRERLVARRESTLDGPAAVDRESLFRWVTDQVFALAEPYRSVILLRYYKGLSTAQIAARQDVPIETVRTQLRRARDRLRLRLEGTRGMRGSWRSWVALVWPGRAAVPSSSALRWWAAAVGVATLGALLWSARPSTPRVPEPPVSGPAAPRPEAGHTVSGRSVRTDTPAVALVPTVRGGAPRAAPGFPLLRGRVQDEQGRPLEDAKVVVYPPVGRVMVAPNRHRAFRSTFTDAGGRFSVETPHRRPGVEILVTASYEGLARTSRIVCEPGPLVMTLVPPGRLAGRVIDAASGRPVPNAGVAVYGRRGYRFVRVGFRRNGARHFEPRNATPLVTTTGPEGTFHLDALAPGPYYLTLYAPGNPFVRLDRKPATVRAGEVTTRDLVVPRLDAWQLTGQVLDKATRSPIEAAEICLRHNALLAARTGPTGRYRIAAVAGRSFGVLARATGYLPESREIETLQYAARRLDFLLTRPGRVRGTVIDPSGSPVAGAAVTADPMALHLTHLSPRTLTDADGRFVIKHVRPGRARRLFAQGPGWCGTPSRPFDLEPGTVADHVVIRLQRGGTIVGRIQVDDPKRPERMHVALQSPDGEGPVPAEMVGSTPGDAAGRFRFDRVPAGTYRFAAWIGHSYHVFPRRVRVRAGEVSTVSLTTREREAIAGVVTGHGRPVPEARISIRGASDFASTDARGRFRLRGLPAGNHHLVIEHDQFERFETDVLPGSILSVSLIRKRPLCGRVLHADSGRPSTLFWVRIYPSGQDAVASDLTERRFFATPDGRFRLNESSDAWLLDARLPGGTFDLEAGTLDGRISPLVRDLSLPHGGGAVPEILLHLERGGRLRGAVTTTRRRPAPNVTITVAPDDGIATSKRLTIRATERGRFRVDALRAGRYAVRARRTDGAEAAAAVTILPDRTSKLRLVLPEATTR